MVTVCSGLDQSSLIDPHLFGVYFDIAKMVWMCCSRNLCLCVYIHINQCSMEGREEERRWEVIK